VVVRSEATLELLQNSNSSDAEALRSVSDRYTNTAAGRMARLFEADTNLGSGIMTLYSDREQAEATIQDAIKGYRAVADTSDDKLLVARAYFGLGRAQESLGKVEDAITAYGQAVAATQSDAVANAAQQRIDLLKKAETQEFLTWFAKQDFKPADPAMPPTLPGSQSLPDLPDLDLPEVAPMKVPDELKGDATDETKSPPGEISLPTEATGTDAGAEASEPEMKVSVPETPAVPDEVKLDNPTVRVTDGKE
jgi:tetratricopeptide (TPR) repeat protein